MMVEVYLITMVLARSVDPAANEVGMHDSRFHGRHHGSNDLDWELVNMDDDDW